MAPDSESRSHLGHRSSLRSRSRWSDSSGVKPLVGSGKCGPQTLRRSGYIYMHERESFHKRITCSRVTCSRTTTYSPAKRAPTASHDGPSCSRMHRPNSMSSRSDSVKWARTSSSPRCSLSLSTSLHQPRSRLHASATNAISRPGTCQSSVSLFKSYMCSSKAKGTGYPQYYVRSTTEEGPPKRQGWPTEENSVHSILTEVYDQKCGPSKYSSSSSSPPEYLA